MTVKNKDKIKASNKRLRLSKTDVAFSLLIAVTAGIAVISTVKMRNVYESSNTDTSQNQIINPVTSTVDVSQTTKTALQSKTKTKSLLSIQTSAQEVTVVHFPVEINEVTLDELLAIKGIGDSLANKILGFRDSIGTIYNMDQLLQIDGIGQSTLALLKKHLYVSDKNYSALPSNTVVETTSPTTGTLANETKELGTEQRERRKVNINTATAEEIADCLLIDIQLADKIIELRETIDYFSNCLELLYVEEISEKLLQELKEYIIV